MKSILLSLFVFSFISDGICQSSDFELIKNNWERVLEAKSDAEKIQRSKRFAGLVSNPAYFTNLEKISDLNQLENLVEVWSPDSALRICSWFIPLSTGEFWIDGTFEFFPLKHDVSKTDSIVWLSIPMESVELSPDSSMVGKMKIPSAYYYDIQLNKDRFDRKFYTLIGWKPIDKVTQRKVVEIFYYKDFKAHLGAPLFDFGNERQSRLSYEYSAQSTMKLNFDPEQEWLLMDHLSPSSPQYEGIYEYYGPDFSFDAFKWENDRWKYYPDVDVDKGIDKKKSDFKKKSVILEEEKVYESE